MLNKELLITGGEGTSAKIWIQTYVPAHVILQSGEDIYLEGKATVAEEMTCLNRDVSYIECAERDTYVYSAINLNQASVELSYRFTIKDLSKPSELILYSDD